MIIKRTKVNDLENLLNLDDEIFPMDSGYWVKSVEYNTENN